MDVKRDAHIVALFGATGTGKSSTIKRALSQPSCPRCLVWDPDGEYPAEARQVPSLAELYRQAMLPAYRLRFVPSDNIATARKQFPAFCLIAWDVLTRRGLPLLVAVDEVADVVEPSDDASPQEWVRLVRRGRKYGLQLYAASQRPAGVNKGLLDNASVIRTGRLQHEPSIGAMARTLGVPAAEVASLAGVQFIERDGLTGEKRRGELSFSAGRSAEKPLQGAKAGGTVKAPRRRGAPDKEPKP